MTWFPFKTDFSKNQVFRFYTACRIMAKGNCKSFCRCSVRGKGIGQNVVNLSKLQGTRPAFTSVNKQIITEKFKMSLKSIIFLLTLVDDLCTMNWNTHGEGPQVLKLLMSNWHSQKTITFTFFPGAILEEFLIPSPCYLWIREKTKIALCFSRKLNKQTKILYISANLLTRTSKGLILHKGKHNIFIDNPWSSDLGRILNGPLGIIQKLIQRQTVIFHIPSSWKKSSLDIYIQTSWNSVSRFWFLFCLQDAILKYFELCYLKELN